MNSYVSAGSKGLSVGLDLPERRVVARRSAWRRIELPAVGARKGVGYPDTQRRVAHLFTLLLTLMFTG